MTITRTLAVALTTATLVAPAAQAMPTDPVNAPGATAVDSASVREQDLRHLSAGSDVRPQATPAPAVPAAEDDASALLAGIVAAAALAAIATAALLQRRRRAATT